MDRKGISNQPDNAGVFAMHVYRYIDDAEQLYQLVYVCRPESIRQSVLSFILLLSSI